MSAQSSPSPSPDEMEARKRIWERIKSRAQDFHQHPSDHGINTKIGTDAGRSSQTVGDWKHGRTPVPPSVLIALASKYGVSARYLACKTDDPHQDEPLPDADLKVLALEMVEEALTRAAVKDNIDPMAGARLAMSAYEMLKKGASRTTILGTLIYHAEGRSDDL